MFKYYNANPLGRNVNDCAVRSISLALNDTWDNTYILLSEYARRRAITLSEVEFIDEFLQENFHRIAINNNITTIKDFIYYYPKGTFLITTKGHITCVKNGILYDTFNCLDKKIWEVYMVKEKE